MNYRDADPHPAESSGGTADAAAAEFLRGLRQLRKQAGLRPAELAARAHYRHEAIKAAEAGPSLPGLPLLAAFVRGCGGNNADVEEWEDWWRTVAGIRTVPLPTARPGTSTATAEAGVQAAAARAAFTLNELNETAREPMGEGPSWRRSHDPGTRAFSRTAVPAMRPSADGPLARDVPRRPSAGPGKGPDAGPIRRSGAPTVAEPRPRGVRGVHRAAPPTPAWPDGQQHAMSDLALAVVVIAVSAVFAIAILLTMFA